MYKFLVFVGVVFLSLLKLTAQDLRFNHITTDDGLSSGNVRTIVQDYEGFIWIGTEDGLHRYDGYEMKIYNLDENDSTSLSSNFILCLFEDSYKNLWVGTMDGGLNLYDRETDSFRSFKHDPENDQSLYGDYIRCIFEGKDKKLFIGLENGAISYFSLSDDIPENIKFNNFEFPVSDDFYGANWVSSIIQYNEHQLLVGSNGGGLFKFNSNNNSFERFNINAMQFDVHSLFMDSKNRLWIGTWGNGLYIYNETTNELANYHSHSGKSKIAHNQVEMISEDAEGNFWIATDDGVNILESEVDVFNDPEFKLLRHNPFESTSLLSNSAKAFYIDNQDRIWIGTYYGGVNVYDKNTIKFRPIRSKVWKQGSLSHNNIFALTEDKNGNIWVGTDGGGLNFLPGGASNLFSDQFEFVDLINSEGNPETKIKCLENDSKNNIWVGTWGGGMFKVDPHSRKFVHFSANANSTKSINANEVLVIESDKDDNLWIGTFQGGLNYYNAKTHQFKYYRHLSANSKPGQVDKINAILIDSKENVWVSREVGGLNLYDPVQNGFITIQKGALTKDLTILSIFEDSEGKLWLGTNSIGLIKYDRSLNSVTIYDHKTGLTGNIITAINEDDGGNLWLSTNKGLFSFDKENSSFSNYTLSDGLQGNQFNQNATCFTSDGKMMFGGVNGMNAFDPENVKIRSELPKIVFTNLWLDNVEANVSDENSPLKRNIILAENIYLNHDQNSFSIGFVALDFDFSNRNVYAYKLGGFDKEWSFIGKDRKATFTNLNPGKYLLQVKASNTDGIWGDNIHSINVIIQPAWWQTWWFKVALISGLILLLYLVFRFRLSYLINQKFKLEKLVKQRTFELEMKNGELSDRVDEIKIQNEMLHSQRLEIASKQNEILAQNEELTSQNDQINIQRVELERARKKLQEINEHLEKLVHNKTKKLKSTIKKLDKTVNELDRFVYSASHDLSAPLKSIRGLVQIAKLEQDKERTKEYYKYIEESIYKLERVIQSLVEFSRNTHLEVKAEPILLHYMISEIFNELSFWPEAAKIEFFNDVPTDCKLISDTQRLKIVLHNIIGNSIKYSDHKKENQFINASATIKEEFCLLTIADNGIGISKERLNHIFNMYYRATELSNGSGLGLYIVKETIIKLGGEIDVDSELKMGTSFMIKLPLSTEKMKVKKEKMNA